MGPRVNRCAVMLGFVLCMVVNRPGTAWSQSLDRAEEAFQSGRALLAQGRYAEACRSFEGSQELDPASGTLLALAYCEELSGLVASAWTHYRAAAELAQQEGHSERRAAASERWQAISDRLSYLTIIVPAEVATLDGLSVKLDGVDVPKVEYDVPLPVDGGNHRIVASARDREAWSATVTIDSERDKKSLRVEIRAAVLHSDERIASKAPIPITETDRGRDRRPLRRRERELFTVGVAGIAVVALGLGVGFGAAAYSSNRASQRGGHCDVTGCDARGLDLRRRALTDADAATWSLIGAGLCTAGAIVLYLTEDARTGGRGPRLKVKADGSAASIELDSQF